MVDFFGVKNKMFTKEHYAQAHNNSGIAHAKNQRILVIDDNPSTHKDWRQLFQGVDANSATEKELAIFGPSSDYVGSEDFEIDSAFQGQEGLEKIRHAFHEGRPYTIVFVDVRMPPGWDGVMAIERIWKEYPDLPAVIYAAYSDYSAPEIVKILGRSEKLLIFKNPPDNEGIHRFAVAFTEEWDCKQATQFEQVLKRAAKLPWARICDPDWIRELVENGDINCMLHLANLYLHGREGYLHEHGGFQQDRDQAIRWLREAARLGNEDAKDKLIEMGEMVIISSHFIDQPRMNEKALWKHVCRWIAVLPGSVVCVILAMFPIHWAVMLIHFAFRNAIVNVEDPISLLARIDPGILERLGYVFFTPLVLIATGSKIAPRCKFQVGIAMAIFWGLLFGCGTGIGIAGIINMNWLWHSISFALGAAGCVIGLLLVHKKQRETLSIE